MEFACPAGAYSHFEEVCQAIQGYLEAVGIQTNLTIQESGYYWDLESKKQLPPLFGDGSSETVGETLPRAMTLLGGNRPRLLGMVGPDDRSVAQADLDDH